MWDIKLKFKGRANRRIAWYYLNHVGYKATQVLECGYYKFQYYLNHVGYKVS